MKYFPIIVLFLMANVQAHSHVSLVYPQKSTSFTVGETIQIEWEETVPHSVQNWDLLFSPDGGKNWETIQEDIDPSVFSYEWVIPTLITTHGRVKIIQDNLGGDYFDTSDDFTITSQKSLFIPSTLSGAVIDLSFQKGKVAFYNGFETNTYGYNQDYLGPTLILTKNDEIRLNVTNNLAETSTLHWHGLHVAPENDGGPHTTIEAGQTWSPSFKVLDNAATYWYHPHLHEHTEEQVTKGGAGFIIVRDEKEAQLKLPRTYGIDDFPIVIQSKAFDANKQFVTKTALDDVILTNGTVDPYLNVPAQVVRLRLLNGSTQRVYNLGLNDNVHFFQIASDGGLLNAPVSLTRLRLSPGERAEILLDLSTQQGKSINLMSFSSELPNGIYGASNPSGMQMGSIADYNKNPLNGSNFNVLKLNVVEATTKPVTAIPTTLISNTPYSEAGTIKTRNLTLTPARMGPTGMVNGPFEINRSKFDKKIINYEIALNSTEIWKITNMTAISHPFHIHNVQFYILDINGQAPPLNMRGRKDVVLVPPMGGTVRFITKFEDFANEEVPYMYHCHMFNHEDEGMMGQFIVFDSTTGISEQDESPIFIYPNPTTSTVSLTGLIPSIIELYDTAGQLLERRASINNEEQFSLTKYASGLYYFNVITTEGSRAYKAVKE